MNQTETKARIEELTRIIVHANHMGVRAELCGDADQRAEAARVYREAKAELAQLEAESQPPVQGSQP